MRFVVEDLLQPHTVTGRLIDVSDHGFRAMHDFAGLAAGLGLAALASHLGFGEEFANMLMIALLVMVAFAAFRFFMARRAAAQNGGMAYAGAGAGAGAPNNAFRMPASPTQTGGAAAGGSMIASEANGE